MNAVDDEYFMKEAIKEARLALHKGEMPIGAVIARGGQIIARGHNLRETANDPTAHAEICAIRAAADGIGDWRLSGCTIYVTLEPCPMCAGAIVQARLARVVYGAPDEKGGCAGSVYRITEDPAFNHFAPADGFVLKDECEALLRDFFENRRAGEKLAQF